MLRRPVFLFKSGAAILGSDSPQRTIAEGKSIHSTDVGAALEPLLSKGTRVRRCQDYGQTRGGCSFPWIIAVEMV